VVDFTGSVVEQNVIDNETQQTLELAENAAANVSENSIATKTKEYFINAASSLKDSLTTFANNYVTPWSTFGRENAVANVTQTTTVETATEVRNIAVANAYQTNANTESLAWRDKYLAELSNTTRRTQTTTSAQFNNQTSTGLLKGWG